MSPRAAAKLKTLYYDVPISDETFLTANKKTLLKRAKKSADDVIDADDVRKFHSAQDPYTLHKRVVRNFKRNPYIITAIDGLWESDLADLSMFAKENDGVKFIMVVIDVFTKYAWVECILNKNASTVTTAFKRVLDRADGRRPVVFRSDRGKEYKNSTLAGFLDSRNIKQQFPQTTSLFKASIAEAFIKNMKLRIYRYFTSKGGKSHRYVHIIQDIIRAYNDTVHTTTKFRPSAIRPEDAPAVYENTRRKHANDVHTFDRSKPKFSVGDPVLVVLKRNVFHTGYAQQYGKEIYRVRKVINKMPYRLYMLETQQRKPVEGKLYAQELQLVAEPP